MSCVQQHYLLEDPMYKCYRSLHLVRPPSPLYHTSHHAWTFRDSAPLSLPTQHTFNNFLLSSKETS